MASRNRRIGKKKGPGPSKLSLPPLTASDQEEIPKPAGPSPESCNDPKRSKETQKTPEPAEDLWNGLGGSDQLEEMLLSKVGKKDGALKRPPPERLTPLQQKVWRWNKYLLSLAVREIMAQFGHSTVPERTMTRFELDDLERLRKDIPEGCAELCIFFTPEELAEIEVGGIATSREDEWDTYLEELEVEAATEEERDGTGQVKSGSSEEDEA